jgi:Zn-dependent protease
LLYNLTPAVLITNVIVLLVAMSVHEFAHAYVAYLNGDTTAKDAGRMTLDPRANIYWPGFIIGVLIGFAILGSAPVNPYRMRNPRWGMFAAVLAGPVSNLLVAVVFAIPLRLGLFTSGAAIGGLSGTVISFLGFLLQRMVLLNVLLFVFNLLPLFPLDGWTVAYAALPPRAAVWWQRQQQTSMYILYGLIALSFVGPMMGSSLARVFPALANGAWLNWLPLNWLIYVPTMQIVWFLTG